MNRPATRAVRAQNQLRDQTAVHHRADVLLLVGVLVLVVLLRLPGFAMPLERDEGAYAYVAWNWLHGGLPYRDAFDHKPPLIYLLYLPVLLGEQPLSASMLRAWATLLILLSVVVAYLIGRAVWQRPAALIAALVFGCAGSAFDLQGLILNTDQALVLPSLLALLAAIRLQATQRQRWAIAAGAALAAAVLIKPVAIVLGPCLVLACAWPPRRLRSMLAGLVLGVALVAVPVAAYFALRGGWHDLIFAIWTYNLAYAEESRQRWTLGGLADMFAPVVPLLLVALGGVALLTRGAASQLRSRRAGVLVAAWALALLIAALGSLRAFVHYYYPLLPLLALLAAPSIPWLWTSGAGRSGRLATSLLLLMLIGPFVGQNLELLDSDAVEQAQRLYGDDGRLYFASAPAVATYLRTRTRPDQYVYIFAAEPEVYVLAQRRSSSRYIYDYPFEHVPGARAELLHDLAARPPSMIVTYHGVQPDGFAEATSAQTMVKLAEIGGYEIFGPP